MSQSKKEYLFVGGPKHGQWMNVALDRQFVEVIIENSPAEPGSGPAGGSARPKHREAWYIRQSLNTRKKTVEFYLFEEVDTDKILEAIAKETGK
jgi:hypothetical protein